MVTDNQVKRLRLIMSQTQNLRKASDKAGMTEKTGRKWMKETKMPSEIQAERSRDWRTRENPFEQDMDTIKDLLNQNQGLEAKTIFDYLNRENGNLYSEGQLRTLQRRIQEWKATEGPAKEVFFSQVHYPGELCASDFTHMRNLGVTIQKQPFPHLIYHFVLTYSNWETGTICYSESFEALSAGFQAALFELGGVPAKHRTDRLSAAVHKECNPEIFTERYKALLAHFNLEGQRIRAGKANENGDVEQSHHRFKKALDQQLMLRGSRDFESIAEYEAFLRKLFKQLNACRQAKFKEEMQHLKALPSSKLDPCKKIRCKVRKGSVVHILNNTYSVNSRLIGSVIEARIYHSHIDIYYGAHRVDTLPRLQGRGKSRIDYAHIIDSLIRKPGAFENYVYQSDLFPGTAFRIAYDTLKTHCSDRKAVRDYLQILKLATEHGESAVERQLSRMLESDDKIEIESLKKALKMPHDPHQKIVESVHVDIPNLSHYDCLFSFPVDPTLRKENSHA